ncbi:hypothetical protein BDP27DRAFT_483554 [Rhodocollybia butyracea]|uniref:Uncharacterized protein n=1 Tax=Rhodocollybia butyracea TaxID=206335 RepID=A0A9P5UFV3_9AGAR|nr:hypothetical protein BDP27DRAFT_483554 [Rhodocollybia butyracea]
MTDLNFTTFEDGPSGPIRNSTSLPGETSRRTSMDTRTTRSSHSSSTRTKDRSKSSLKELALLLAVEKNKSESLRLSLDEARKQLDVQSRRIEETEKNLIETTSAFMRANKERLDALQEARVAVDERELYRAQLLAAQSDIDKARNVVKDIDERRVQAERDAAKYKRSARELREERLLFVAREEGRRMGFREGLQRARAEVGFFDIAEDGFVTPPTGTSLDDMDEDGNSFYNDDVDQEPEPVPQPMPADPPGAHQPQRYPQAPLQENLAPISLPPSNGTGQIHPTIVHNMPLSPRHPPASIPPDGMIPVDDPSGLIMLPPPHELSPAPPIMGLPPHQIPEDEPRIVPPPGSRRSSIYPSHSEYHPGQYYRGQSSPESNSTAMSQFDILTEPNMMANISPMSVIPEVASAFTSPSAPSMHGRDLQRSSSMHSTASTHRSPSTNPQTYTPRAVSDNDLPDANRYPTGSSPQVGRKQSTEYGFIFKVGPSNLQPSSGGKYLYKSAVSFSERHTTGLYETPFLRA